MNFIISLKKHHQHQPDHHPGVKEYLKNGECDRTKPQFQMVKERDQKIIWLSPCTDINTSSENQSKSNVGPAEGVRHI